MIQVRLRVLSCIKTTSKIYRTVKAEAKDTLLTKSIAGIAKFDKIFSKMLWQSLGQRQNKITTGFRKLSQYDAPIAPVRSVNISFSAKNIPLRVSSRVAQRADRRHTFYRYFKNSILDNFGLVPYNSSNHGLINRGSTKKRSLFLNLLKIQQAALKARSNYLAYRTQYELDVTTKEINKFHKVLSRSALTF